MDNGVKNKNKFNHIRLDFEQMHTFYNLYMRNKSKRDNVSWLKAYLVYMWIYYWQLLTKVGFGRVRKQDVFDQIGETLIEPKPNVVVNALIRAGMIVWSKSEYKGVTNYCLQCTYLNEKMRNGNINTDQAKDEVIQLESSAKGSTEMGEYYQYGKRFYRDINGESHIIPLDAPQRPNNTAFWDGKQWRESDSAMQKQQNEFDSWLRVPKNGVYYDSGRYYYKDANGNSVWVPDGIAFDRPSKEHVFDSEADRWCLPDEVTVRELEF